MRNENQNILELWKKLPQNCFTVGGVVFPKSQWEEVCEAWFKGERLPTPKRP
jgi:hypothetical protein